MNNNLKIIGEKTKIKLDGLAPVTGYEPWPVRTLDSVRQSIADGIPVLIRVHSAADYPCENFDDGYKLDMESHAILIVGYDDTDEMFDVVDPWKKEWGGQFGGIERRPYSILIYAICVNCTLDKATRIAPPYKEVEIVNKDDNKYLKIKLGFYTPKGYIMDQNETMFTSFDIKMGYVFKDSDREQVKKIEGKWKIGEYAEAIFPLEREMTGKCMMDFQIDAALEGKRPYHYSDKIHFEFSETVEIENASIDYHEELMAAK